jgi:hypothetical protein
MELMNTRMFDWENGNASGLAKYMDIIIINNDCVIYNKSLDLAQTIFINTRLKEKLIIYFIDNILPQLSQPVNLIISGEDYTFPNNIDKRMDGINHRLQEFKTLGKHAFINTIFVENLDENIENAIPIPLGVNPREGPVTTDYFLKYEFINSNKPLRVTNFNRTRDGKGQWEERGDVLNLCKNSWSKCFIQMEHNNHDEYLKTMGKYLFTLCVHGGGLDVNPKLWEALLIGVIPIIKENKPYTDIYVRLDLPVVIVKDWNIDTINEDDLMLWRNKYYSYFTNDELRKRMLYHLSLNYWITYVNTCV